MTNPQVQANRTTWEGLIELARVAVAEHDASTAAANTAAPAPSPPTANASRTPIPVSTGSPAVVSIPSIETRIANLENRLTTLLNTISNQVQELFMRVAVTDENSIARKANSLLMSPNDTLVHLVDVRIGNPVADFPNNSSEIEALSDEGIIRLLDALGGSTARTPITRQQAFRRKIGLRS